MERVSILQDHSRKYQSEQKLEHKTQRLMSRLNLATTKGAQAHVAKRLLMQALVRWCMACKTQTPKWPAKALNV